MRNYWTDIRAGRPRHPQGHGGNTHANPARSAKVVALATLLGLGAAQVGCTTIIVENPHVDIDLLVAIPPPAAFEPLEHGTEPWPGDDQPQILRETTE